MHNKRTFEKTSTFFNEKCQKRFSSTINRKFFFLSASQPDDYLKKQTISRRELLENQLFYNRKLLHIINKYLILFLFCILMLFFDIY